MTADIENIIHKYVDPNSWILIYVFFLEVYVKARLIVYDEREQELKRSWRKKVFSFPAQLIAVDLKSLLERLTRLQPILQNKARIQPVHDVQAHVLHWNFKISHNY